MYANQFSHIQHPLPGEEHAGLNVWIVQYGDGVVWWCSHGAWWALCCGLNPKLVPTYIQDDFQKCVKQDFPNIHIQRTHETQVVCKAVFWYLDWKLIPREWNENKSHFSFPHFQSHILPVMNPIHHKELTYWHRQAILIAVISATVSAAFAAAMIYHDSTVHEPYHTSWLSGPAWVHELLLGNSHHMQENLGLGRHTFCCLVTALEQKQACVIHVTGSQPMSKLCSFCIQVSPCTMWPSNSSKAWAQSHSMYHIYHEWVGRFC